MGNFFLNPKIKYQQSKWVWVTVVALSICSTATSQTPLPKPLDLYYKTPKDLSEIEELVRYRWFEKALIFLKDYSSEDSKTLFLKAESLAGLHRYNEALPIYQKLSKNGEPSFKVRALLRQAKMLSRLRRYPEALAIYEAFVDGAANPAQKNSYVWMAFKTALEGKKYEQGLHFLKFARGPKAFWWRGWCYFRLEKYKRALGHWKLIQQKGGLGFHEQALFWRAQIYQKQGQTEKALHLLRELTETYPISYYGHLALTQLYPDSKKRSQFVATTWSATENGNAKGFPNAEGALRLKWEEKYPRYQAAIVKKEASRRGLDHYLIWAMMKQESAFQDGVISSTGAVGLMQLMPQTALKLAPSSAKKPFMIDSLFDVKTNIQLGALYLKFLKKLFQSGTVYFISAYNAGEEAVSRWLALREKEPPLIFIEEIPYEETQNYVKKILNHYWVYHWLYEGSMDFEIFGKK